MEAYCYSVLYFWQVGFGFLSPPALVTTGMCGLLPIHFYLSDIPKLFCLSLSATCQDILSIIQTLPGSSVLLGLVQTKRILDKVHEEKQLFFLIKTKPQPLPCENHPQGTEAPHVPPLLRLSYLGLVIMWALPCHLLTDEGTEINLDLETDHKQPGFLKE